MGVVNGLLFPCLVQNKQPVLVEVETTLNEFANKAISLLDMVSRLSNLFYAEGCPELIDGLVVFMPPGYGKCTSLYVLSPPYTHPCASLGFSAMFFTVHPWLISFMASPGISTLRQCTRLVRFLEEKGTLRQCTRWVRPNEITHSTLPPLFLGDKSGHVANQIRLATTNWLEKQYFASPFLSLSTP